MSEQEPLNVRVARALGLDVTEDRTKEDNDRWWYWQRGEHIPEHLERVPDYVNDDALCWRIMVGNRVAMLRHPRQVREPWQASGSGHWGYGVSAEEAILEWFVASVAAGVDVVVPRRMA